MIVSRKWRWALAAGGLFLAMVFLGRQAAGYLPIQAAALSTICERPGWFPEDFDLKDHSVFLFGGYYYIVSIHLPGEDQFAYGRSSDLCVWEDLGPIIEPRDPGGWDATAIWAPYVYEEQGVYYLYYTGVKGQNYHFTQSIMLATSANPADPAAWQPQGMVFQPNHDGMVWQDGEWADCRDPMVAKIGSVYYLYYTGRDTGGGIIGLATASSPAGPWLDWGAIIPPLPEAVPESATLAQYDGAYYLFYHHPGQGEFYRIGPGPTGPWQVSLPFRPGWAHEVWQGLGGEWYTSFLTDYTVTISPLTWDSYYNPPHPFIGASVNRLMLPLILAE